VAGEETRGADGLGHRDAHADEAERRAHGRRPRLRRRRAAHQPEARLPACRRRGPGSRPRRRRPRRGPGLASPASCRIRRSCAAGVPESSAAAGPVAGRAAAAGRAAGPVQAGDGRFSWKLNARRAAGRSRHLYHRAASASHSVPPARQACPRASTSHSVPPPAAARALAARATLPTGARSPGRPVPPAPASLRGAQASASVRARPAGPTHPAPGPTPAPLGAGRHGPGRIAGRQRPGRARPARARPGPARADRTPANRAGRDGPDRVGPGRHEPARSGLVDGIGPADPGRAGGVPEASRAGQVGPGRVWMSRPGPRLGGTAAADRIRRLTAVTSARPAECVCGA
jgi:hypothetical protein